MGCQTGSMSLTGKAPGNNILAADSFNQIRTIRIQPVNTDPLVSCDV
jgi:hypothetical protein